MVIEYPEGPPARLWKSMHRLRELGEAALILLIAALAVYIGCWVSERGWTFEPLQDTTVRAFSDRAKP
jgi:hypothetical protein